MARHNDIGHTGEQMATAFLTHHHYTIEAVNWRYGRAEIDIIARTPENTVVFIEVKTRRNTWYGPPESFVTPRKTQLMAQAAIGYLAAINHDWEFRFDVVAIQLHDWRTASIRHFEDAFFPAW